jgi:hypothetical protein
VFGLTKPAPILRFDEHASGRPANSRDKQLRQFWERRSGKELTMSSAREMQSNVEGLIGLLVQWDREDCTESRSAVRLRSHHDTSKS